jgi:hypothetical protein
VTHDANVASCAPRTVTVHDGLIASDVINLHPRLPGAEHRPEVKPAVLSNGASKAHHPSVVP